jgi:DNA-directed RNA polymerase subunit beta
MSLIRSVSAKSSVARKSYTRLPQILEVPDLIEIQLDSFRWFQEEGLKQVLEEISPISDFTGNKLELTFLNYEFREPRQSEYESRQHDLTYATPLYVRARLLIKATGEIKEQDIFLGDMPLMTAKGTFITSGAERVVVSQLLRSPGAYFTIEENPGGLNLCHAKLISNRGAWLEFDTSTSDVISVKINGKRKIAVTVLLRALGYNSDALFSMFAKEDNSPNHHYIKATIERDPAIRDESDALLDIYRKLRPGDPPSIDNAKKLIETQLFNAQHYDLGVVGRYKLNKKLGLNIPESQRSLTREDLVEIIRHIILINNGKDTGDDIDHLGNRRIRTVGELIQNQFRIGLLRLERVAKERMSTLPIEVATPSVLVNTRPVVASIREFFSSSQLSQFMDQPNPLAELTHKRRLSAMGPGGLSRERAGFEARDVHYSHYGRICPIETPEGPNVGLIGSLAIYGKVNKYGFIETPYRKVFKDTKEMKNRNKQLLGKTIREAVLDSKKKTIVEAGTLITPEIIAKLSKISRNIQIVPYVSDEIEYMSADMDEKYPIAQANARLDDKNQFIDERVEARVGGSYIHEVRENIDYMDVSPKQIFSVAAALIPFLEHDDANRALMGSNMQRQAVPLLRPSAPIVATGMELEAVRNSGQVLIADNPGIVTSVTSSEIIVTRDDGEKDTYVLLKFVRTNQGTCINQRPIVNKGDRVEKGQVLVDSSSSEQGELALGQNVVCAFMSWRGYNYEDAIIISSRLVESDSFTSIHIEKYEVEARDTKLGPEEITRDIPNVGEESLRELDAEGIIRIGAKVGPDDILVGKITPKGETELSAEEKLLRAIFGEKAREVNDTSLRVPHGEWGKVVNVKVFTGDELSAGVNTKVQVWIAQKRPVSVGDKMAGRHGNKGVVSIIAPAEDMPFLPDGTPVDVVLNPIGVPSRMNIGQVLETHIGWVAQVLGFKVLTPVFDGADDIDIEDGLARAWVAQQSGAVELEPGNHHTPMNLAIAKKWVENHGYDSNKVFNEKYRGQAADICQRIWLEELGINAKDMKPQALVETIHKVKAEKNMVPPTIGKFILRDGYTGEPFDQAVTVGNIYIMKLNHLVEDKVHARSTGPYSLISQQPLGGKAQFGGQRFGEMEVWTLEAYGVAHILQEMLTIKSDDVTGRTKAYEAILKNEDILQPSVPESFKVLVKELQSLGLAIEVINEGEEVKTIVKNETPEPPMLEVQTGAVEEAPPVSAIVNETKPKTEIKPEEVS